MFWGLILRANKRYSQTVTKTFHVSQAVLDVTQTTTDGDVQVVLASENENYILCTLSKKKDVLQVPLDLVFSEGDDIAFSCVGGVVHLTGYLVPNEEDFGGFGGEEGDSDLELGEEEEEELSAQSPPKKLSKKQEALKKLLEAEHGDDTDEDDSDVDENGLEEDSDDDGEEEEDDDEDDDDDEIDEDDSEEEEEIVEPVAKKAKQQNGKAAPANGKAPKAEKPVAAAPAAAAQAAKPKVLTGGVKVEDIRVGKGPEAKNGKTVQVYYEGRLASNNKMFDSSKTGKGFSFRLGQGEVIRGWDVGVAGMKVGSKRRITCPANMAYGAKGALPAIPGNATLVFEVELRGIK